MVKINHQLGSLERIGPKVVLILVVGGSASVRAFLAWSFVGAPWSDHDKSLIIQAEGSRNGFGAYIAVFSPKRAVLDSTQQLSPLYCCLAVT